MNSTDFMDVSQAADLPTFERNLVSAGANLGFPLTNCVLTHLGPIPNQPLAVYTAGNTPEAYISFANMDLTIRDPFMAELREGRSDQVVFVRSQRAR